CASCSPVEEAKDDDVSRLEEVLQREKEVWDEAVFRQGVSYALLKVAQRGRLAAARTLLHHGALLDFEDPVSYYSSLHMAVMGVHPHMVELLVQHGADINRRDRVHESSALDLAAEDCGRLPCVKTLLQLGADVNACDDNGKTALLHALGNSDPVRNDNSENIRLLLEGGARVRVRTRDGDDTLWWVVEFLQQFSKEAELSSDEADAFGAFCTRVISMLLDHGAHIHSDVCPESGVSRGDVDLEEAISLGRSLLCRFPLLFPLCVSLLSRGVSLSAICCCHLENPALECAPCDSGVEVLLSQLERRLGRNPNLDCAAQSEVLEKALALLDISEACCARPGFDQGLKSAASRTNPPLPASHPAQQIRQRLHDERNQPCALTRLCRRFLRRQLATPLEDSVALLPLPPRLQDFLVPEVSFLRRPSWDRLRRSPDLSQPSSPQPDESQPSSPQPDESQPSLATT
ncbi:ankyrin repeat and SOCS box protein 6-like, partial [Engraulis encrasicolus]|uniref:ankyrin repeat and SOCS box protein 6-like n=1 Tax=Engraulis encrasicolus TaxID=184585 RepID=UPI002FCF8C7E